MHNYCEIPLEGTYYYVVKHTIGEMTMDSVYRLPIVYNTGIVTECWTSYKMAIILTSEKSRPWLASHFDIYMEEDGWTVFGNNFDAHPLNYFNDILEINEIKYEEISADIIINTLIELLNKGYYVTVDCLMEKGYIHERMIYGYDLNEKVFFTLAMGSETKMRERKVGFARLKHEYTKMVEFLKTNKRERYLRRNWFYTITTFRFNENYRNDNSAFEMLKKIFREIHGYKIIRTEDPFLINDDIKIAYTGLACLQGIGEIIKRKGFQEHSLTMALVKLYEHRVIIFNGFKWFCAELNINDSKINGIIKKYKDTIWTMKNLYLLSLKNDIKRNSNFENILIDKLTLQYYTEKRILTDFYEEGVKAFAEGECK